MVSSGTRHILLVAAIAYVACGQLTHGASTNLGAAASDSDGHKTSSGKSDAPTGPAPTSKPVATADTRLATVTTTTTRNPAASNVTNATRVSTSSKPSRGHQPGDGVLNAGKDDDNVDRTPKTRHYFFSTWLTWKEDNYVMSILIPIACGMSAALLILCSLACIGCCRKKCRARARRKFHRNIDPKSIRKLKTADRIKLLAASSDEEF